MSQDYISDVHFVGINFSNHVFSRKNFSNCTFEKCNLSNITLKNTTLNDIRFKGCKILWLKFWDIDRLLSNFNFYDCTITLTSFFWLSLKGIHFEDCKITESDFTNTYLENAVFWYCDLLKTTFLGCNFKNADLRWSFNFSIDPQHNKFSKTKFSREYCEGLLHQLDIELM